jgi:two-component system OmpR family response regulator
VKTGCRCVATSSRRGRCRHLHHRKGEATDRIVGLEIGADDYVVKPFDPRELVARIKSVLRRAGRDKPPPDEGFVFAFDGWRLDPLKRRLTDPEGAVVAISSAEFRLLVAFLEHPRQVLDRDRLLDMVQGREAHLFDRAIDNQVSRLRRKIEADSKNPQLIQTVWGGGYMLAADGPPPARGGLGCVLIPRNGLDRTQEPAGKERGAVA